MKIPPVIIKFRPFHELWSTLADEPVIISYRFIYFFDRLDLALAEAGIKYKITNAKYIFLQGGKGGKGGGKVGHRSRGPE